MIKIKVSYMSESELAELLQHVKKRYPGMKWKRSKNQQGGYKKAYIELVGTVE